MARSVRASSVVDRSLLVFCLLASTIVVFLPRELRDGAAAALRRTIAAPLAELQRRAELGRAAFVTYDDRMLQRGEIGQRANDARALEAENARLRTMLGLAARLDWGFVTAEAIPNDAVDKIVQSQLVETFSITAGSRAGVEPFTPVVAPEGLIGMVHHVDPATSQAITYSHADFRVSAMSPDGAAFGIVQPHLGPGSERGLLEIRGVPFRSPLTAGQLVISSGLGATYPAGIPVGTVIRELQTPEKWARTYLLQPSVSLASVGPVLLLMKKRSDEGVRAVWTSVPAADSAARAIAVAGDSLAQAAAIRESAARRAAMDSLVRDSLPADSVGPTPSRAPSPAPAAAPVPSRRDSAPPAARPATPTTPAVAAPPSTPRAAPDSAARARARADSVVRARVRADSAARARARQDTAGRARPRPDTSGGASTRSTVPSPGGRP